MTLRDRNEGIYGGYAPPDAPAGGAGAHYDGSSGLGARGPINPQDQQEAFRVSMYRAAERQKDGARFRAAMARMQRPQIEVPPPGRALRALLVPAAVVGIWVVNYMLFMR